MEISINKVSEENLNQNYSIVVPNQVVNERIDAHIDRISPTLAINGFRKGKVPKEIIKKFYSSSILKDEVDKLISELVSKIIKDNDLELASKPQIEITSFDYDKDGDMNLSVIIERYPDVPEIDLVSAKFTVTKAEIADADIEKALKEITKGLFELEKQNDNYLAQNGDTLKIDYSGSVDQEKFEGGSDSDHKLELGSNSFIDTFEEQLVGKKSGDEVLVTVNFPESYHKEELSGKKAEFQVKIKEILSPKKEEITDNFVKEKLKIDSVESLRSTIKGRISDSYMDLSRHIFKSSFTEFVKNSIEIETPKSLIEQVIADSSKQKTFNDGVGESPDQIEAKQKSAQESVKYGIVISSIAKRRNVKVSNDDMNREFIKIASKFPGYEKFFIDYYKNNPELLDKLKESVLENKVLDSLISEDAVEKKIVGTAELDELYQSFLKSSKES